jgi:hypothetical protein
MPGEKEFSVPGGMAGGLLTRLAGLGLALIALGPVLVVATALVLTVLAVIDLIRPLVADVSAVAAIVESRISPQIAAVESAFARVGARLSQLQSQIEGALRAVEHVGNVQIAAGQWGRTPSVHITILPKDLSIASVLQAEVQGPFGGIVNTLDTAANKAVDSVGSIKTGQVFDQATPSLPIPPGPIVLPITPVEQALAPLGPNGVVGKAVKAAESEVGAAIAEAAKLQQPILAVKDGVAGLPAPLQAALGPLVSALVVVVIAFVALVLVGGVSVALMLITRPAEFVRALLTRGPIGHSHLLLPRDAAERLRQCIRTRAVIAARTRRRRIVGASDAASGRDRHAPRGLFRPWCKRDHAIAIVRIGTRFNCPDF